MVDRPTVSGHHCRLTQTGEAFLLEDLTSRNGTFVDGQRISAPIVVSRKDNVTLGRNIALPWPDPDEIASAPPIRIGRAPDNDVVLDYPVVSAYHARIVTNGGQFWLHDLNSTNGTAIGSPDGRIAREKLAPTDAVYFGSLRVVASRLLAGNLAMGAEPYTERALGEQPVVIGRDPSCDRILDDPMVSRRHARLTRSGTSFTLEDLGSTNGTFVNGRQVTATVSIQPGDTIAIGTFTFKVAADGQLEERNYRGNVSVEAQGVTVAVGERRLLEAVSLTVYPSEFVALMGPSGAGKTTLMNALNGYTRPTARTVLFNGLDLYANYGQFQSVIGYVPQDDIMHADLTVGQALYYTARLRLPADSSDDDIARRVQAVISQLGLESTEQVLIGSPQKKGISGGQRKRVNLAMELLTDPSVLFLDEPTSGLSSEDALNVMQLLRRLADEGKTILLTIHQPSLAAYRLLDNLILVAKDAGSNDPGRLVFYGPAHPQALHFFNPDRVSAGSSAPELLPDDVLRGLGKRRTEDWADQYAASPVKRQYVDERAGRAPPAPPPEAGFEQRRCPVDLAQGWTLVRRSLAVKLKDRVNTAILMCQAPVIALLIVLVFGSQAAKEVTTENWGSVAGATSTTIFLAALAAIWFGCSNSAREIVAEWAIYHRERMVNLKIPSYVGAKLAVLGGLCVVQCAVLWAVVYWGAGMRGPVLAMFLVLLLASLVGLAIGLTVSAVARTSEAAVALLPLILLPLVMLAGALQPLHNMNRLSAALAQTMPSRWAFESLLLLEAQRRPEWTPPAVPLPPPASKDAKPPVPSRNAAQDMAESFFPKASQRMGVRAGVIALAAMFVLLLVVADHVILRARDVH